MNPFRVLVGLVALAGCGAPVAGTPSATGPVAAERNAAVLRGGPRDAGLGRSSRS